jgi:hypothetical protein
MCFKWFHKPDPDPVPVKATRRLLTFGKNKYGGGNNLNGCVHDSENIAKKLLELFPDFDVRKFTDYDVTVAKYKSEVSVAITTLNPGATVLILPDSCFSGTITRFMNNPHPVKNRFFHSSKLPVRERVNVRLFRGQGDIRWIVISGCQENQTSADCYEGGQYVGAFTYFAIKALTKGITYREWYNKIKTYLPSAEYNQAPTLEGPEELLNRKVFEDEVLVIHNSSHGTQVPDLENDESDGYDEALYFDKPLTDDEINLLLQKIP